MNTQKKSNEAENPALNKGDVSRSAVKLDEILNDAKLHVNEAQEKIREWNIKLSERIRHQQTIEIIQAKK